jgi:hypothetical protein
MIIFASLIFYLYLSTSDGYFRLEDKLLPLYVDFSKKIFFSIFVA